MTVLAAILCAALGLTPTPAPAAAKTSATLAREAREAYDRGDRETFRRNTEEIARRRPGDVWVLYNLACGQALTGQGEAAARTLTEFAALRAWADLAADTDLASVKETAAFRAAAASLTTFRQERVSSGATRAFTIAEKGLVPEGVAWDPVTKSFFVSSIRRRKIFRIDAGGRASVFVPAARDGLQSAMGMVVDPKRRTLWVASQPLPSMDGFVKGQTRSAAVFAFDADTGVLRRAHTPAPSAEAGFDDVALAPDGRLYVNDGTHPRIWTIAPGGALEVFVEDAAMGGTQGLAVSDDGKRLYASDYRSLFAIDVATRRVTRLNVPRDLALNGIDGLAFFAGSLIGIQNGVEPHRVVRLDLEAGGLAIARARILEMNHPDFDEPTLGAVLDGTLYVTANSQGQMFLNEKKPVAPEQMKDAVILKIPLR